MGTIFYREAHPFARADSLWFNHGNEHSTWNSWDQAMHATPPSSSWHTTHAFVFLPSLAALQSPSSALYCCTLRASMTSFDVGAGLKHPLYSSPPLMRRENDHLPKSIIINPFTFDINDNCSSSSVKSVLASSSSSTL